MGGAVNGSGAPSCQACVHMSLSLVDKQTAGQMLCRSRPPVPFAVPIQSPQGISVQVLTLWPIVQKSDICADFDDGSIDGEHSDEDVTQ